MVSLLPKSLQDSSNLALEKCLEKAFDIDLKPFIIYFFDQVDTKLLPILKKHFRVDDFSWKLAKTEQQKRNLLKVAVPTHRRKGTPDAIKSVFDALDIQGVLQEWFEYEGRPMHFKVALALIDRAYDAEALSDLQNMIRIHKNARSILEEISIESQFTLQPNFVSYTNSENEIMIG
jgi:phage tail P2-like protein